MMLKTLFLSLILCCLVLTVSPVTTKVFAETVRGVSFPEQISIQNKVLNLVGVGLKRQMMVDIHLTAYYLENPPDDAVDAICSDQVKQIIIHILYDEVKPEDITRPLDREFMKNSPHITPNIKEELKQFKKCFTTRLQKGERILITYIPGHGTDIEILGRQIDTIPGKDFMMALSAIWLGPYPASEEMKQGMLGKRNY